MPPPPQAPPSVPRVIGSRYVASANAPGQWPPPVGVEIAFAGRSNVGKSSLLNGLLGRQNLARTSRTPGCTRTISFFEVRSSDQSLITLADLPGYGYARRSKAERSAWGSLVDAYLLERPTLRAVALLVDIRRGPEQEELDLITLLRRPVATSRPPVQILLVATKLDKLARAAQKPALRSIEQAAGTRAYGFSVRQPELVAPLWRRLRAAAGLDGSRQGPREDACCTDSSRRQSAPNENR